MMICFPNAKINIGLHVLNKRPDGFHNIESVFYPVPLCDSLEIKKSPNVELVEYGLKIPGKNEDNLCLRAFRLFQEKYSVPNVEIHLLKNIPMGAGLGGGSADAAFLLKLLNEYFSCAASDEVLKEMALQVGSDCPFFIENKPKFVKGRGEVFEQINIDLAGKQLLLVNPHLHISTVEAYKNITPKENRNLKIDIEQGLATWKENISNDFETYAFEKYPALRAIKEKMYKLGADYASMSGTGSTMYGIFDEKVKELPRGWKNFFVRWIVVNG